MFLGGMIMGPLGGWLIKKIDQSLEEKIPIGFEMLVNNFSRRHPGADPGPARPGRGRARRRRREQHASGAGVDFLVNRLLPLADLIIEPAKILFLNNALNHGVLAPAGVAEVAKYRQGHPLPARDQPRARAWACCSPSCSPARAC